MNTRDANRLIFVKRVGELAPVANFNATELAHLLGICTRQLQRKFQYYLNCSPRTWLNQARIRASKQLLISGASVKRTAIDLGFKQVSHFCRHFKSENGVTASEFARFKDV